MSTPIVAGGNRSRWVALYQNPRRLLVTLIGLADM